MFSVTIIGFGLAMIVVTLARGGGPTALGVLFGAHLHRHRRRPALRVAARMRPRQLLGVPFLYAIAASAVGFSIYFSIGVVADRGLGLTPLIFLAAGIMFAITTLTYVEGGAMYRERGGSSTFARHAFNELISFIAGWAILIDYVIVISAAAISVPHYLTPVWGEFAGGSEELVVAGAVILLAAYLNVAGVTGGGRQNSLVLLALADLGLQLLVILVGAVVVLDPELLTAELDLFTTPSLKDIVYAAVVATIAYAGIEAASDLAPDLDFEEGELTRVASAGAVIVPLMYAGMAAVALMAVPVVPGPDGPETALAGEFVEAPVLGVVQSFEPAWLADAMQWAVVLTAVPVLVWAANTSMLGLARHVYVLATNRQIPSWAGRLERTHATPFIAIGIAAALAFALAVPGDIEFLAGVYAFGALLAATIAHLSIVSLRRTEPDRERPYRVPWNVRVGGWELPLPAVFAAVVSGLAWLSVIAFHEQALYVGGGWMLFGLVTYVVYRKLVEETSLTERVTVPEVSLKKQASEIEYSNILVPVFGTDLDDEIIATAGRLADAEVKEGKPNPRMDVVFVAELPLTVPIDAPLSKNVRERADRALARADQVGDEYENVEVGTAFVRARSAGAGIVAEARQRGAEVIVMGAEPPTRIRGGAVLGGHRRRAAGRDRGGDGVRAEEGAVPRPAHRAARGARAVVRFRAMFVLIVGCGRVGSSVARSMLRAGNEVSCIDEDPEAHARLEVGLESSWEDSGGQFTVGTGLETDASGGRGDREGGCVRRLHRRRQHQHRHRPDRAAPLQHPQRRGPHPRPAAGRVVCEAGDEHGLSDQRRDRDAGERAERGGPRWVSGST